MLPLLLYITDTESYSGAEVYLATLLEHADRTRFRVGLLLPPRDGNAPLVQRALAAGADVTFLDAVHIDGLNPALVAQAGAALAGLHPQIAHFVLASPRRCAETALAAALLGVPRRVATFQLVLGVPNFPGVAGTIRTLNRRLQYRTYTHGIAVSTGNARRLVEQHGFPAERLRVIPNGVDTTVFAPRPHDGRLRAAWGVPADAPLIGQVGRLSYQKGHTVLFEALRQVWQRIPSAHVVLLGSGEMEDELRQQARQLERATQVHFVGQERDMPAALTALDVFVLPSYIEGLSIALLEAMACGLACVASATDGTVDVLRDGENGLLVPPRNSASLAGALIRVLEDRPLRERIGRAARATVVASFSQQQMLKQTSTVYG